MLKQKLLALAASAAITTTALAQPFTAGRIAISSDGNFHDPDDVPGTSLSIAMLAKSGNQSKLVWYGYSDHIWTDHAGDDPTPNVPLATRLAQMKTAAEGTAQTWGGFNMNVFFQAYDEAAPVPAFGPVNYNSLGAKTKAAIDALTAQVNASTANNRLFILAAGPVEVIWQAINRSNSSARQHVTVVSHSTWNNEHGKQKHNGKNFVDVGNLGVQTIQIADQNDHNNPNGGLRQTESNFTWMSNHPDSRVRYVWDRHLYFKSTFWGGGNIFDASDAGMVWYLLFGYGKDGKGFEGKSAQVLKAFFDGPDGGPGGGTPGGSNLLQNPGFENNLTGWNTGGSAPPFVQTAGPRSGSRHISFYSPNAFTSYLGQWVGNVPGGTYRARLWMRGDGLNWVGFQVKQGGTILGSTTLTPNSNYTEFTINNISIPNNATIEVMIWADMAAGGWMRMDDFELASTSGGGGGGPTAGTITANVTEDAFLEGGVNQNTSVLKVQQSGPERTAYLKFNVTGVTGKTVTRTRLRLVCTQDNGTPRLRVFPGTSNNWGESTINGSNAPSQGSLIGEFNSFIAIGQTVDVDLSNFATTDGTYTLIVRGANGGNDAWFHSKESSSNRPVLIIDHN